MDPLLDACIAHRDWALAVIRNLVAAESPSDDPVALEQCAGRFVEHATGLGASVRRVPARTTADHVIAEWPAPGPSVLLVGHLDTVWPVGQLRRMPLEESGGRLAGPGVLDMKAGLGIGLLALRALRTAGPAAYRPHVTFLVTSDEEVGSRTSRPTLERLAQRSAAVLVLEPALPNGAVKTARKGVGDFTIVAHGIAAHAGVDPGAGASAIHELAHQIRAVAALADPTVGVSVNVGVIEGGTRTNVVAEQARARIDVRISRIADGARLAAALSSLRPVDGRVRLEVSGGFSRPPMERSAGVAWLYEVAREVAARQGWDLPEGATGGASDGNFTAALGVPTLDGLGAVGDGPHALTEHVLTAELPRRAALVAGLLARIGESPGSGPAGFTAIR